MDIGLSRFGWLVRMGEGGGEGGREGGREGGKDGGRREGREGGGKGGREEGGEGKAEQKRIENPNDEGSCGLWIKTTQTKTNKTKAEIKLI